jgi:hypothetical protein
MIIKESTVEEYDSCNFCDRGELNSLGCGLNYPYEKIFIIKSEKTLVVTICENCLNEIKKYKVQ